MLVEAGQTEVEVNDKDHKVVDIGEHTRQLAQYVASRSRRAASTPVLPGISMAGCALCSVGSAIIHGLAGRWGGDDDATELY